MTRGDKYLSKVFLWSIVITMISIVYGSFASAGSNFYFEGSQNIIDAEITAYNPVEAQSDSTPLIMASGRKVYLGAIACPGWLEFGRRVRIVMTGKVYVCEDRMNKRYRSGQYFDIMMFDGDKAKEWGRRRLQLEIL